MNLIALISAFVISVGASALEPLISRIDDAGYLTGSFSQTDIWALTLEEETSEGTLHIAHPNLFLLAYSEPSGCCTGYDGEMLYTIEADVEQVILYPSSEPASFLHLIERAADSTSLETVELLGDSVVVHLQGDLGQGITGMTVGYTLSDSLPFFFETRDANGNRTAYRMWDIEVTDLPVEDVFVMNIPDGYLLVEPEGM